MNPMSDYEPGSGPSRTRRQILMSRPPLVPVYRVGERFRSRQRTWPNSTEYSFGPSGHELTLFRPNITRQMIEDVRRGPTEFAIIVEASIIVLAYRFGESIPWEDALYCWHLQPEFRRVIPSREARHAGRSLLWVTLVGSDDGIIHAQRGLTLSPEFSDSLHDAIRNQAMRAFDPNCCALAVGSVYNARESIEARLDRATARSAGNA
ncbi:MAG: hypothetical protein ABS79_06420 [Planctomycetes bacterium SCN 63-9]|nr:MAG: hypothetical protein ABS79_06420 [Planctomycetes bacterium SCN 63-9]